jgi:hypothetical protein
MWWRPVLSGLSHIFLSLSLSRLFDFTHSLLPMSFYQRIMSACVSFHLVNADDSAPTPIFIFKWRSFIFGLLGGWNKYHALRKLNHLFHELTSTKMCDPLISMCDKRIFSSKLYCHQRLKLDLGFFEWAVSRRCREECVFSLLAVIWASTVLILTDKNKRSRL